MKTGNAINEIEKAAASLMLVRRHWQGGEAALKIIDDTLLDLSTLKQLAARKHAHERHDGEITEQRVQQFRAAGAV